VRAFLATCGAVAALLAISPAGAGAQSAAEHALQTALGQGMQRAGGSSGALVVDLGTGQTLFSASAGTGRLPASVEKLYTTSAALLRWGPNATLSTNVLGAGTLDSAGGWHGNLYLKGGGDPTFGSAAFDRSTYGTGATMQRLVTNLIHHAGIRAVYGRVIGDESYFDSRRGTPATGFRRSSDVEGLLSGLAYDRGFANWGGSVFQARPALVATQQFAAALRAGHVKVPAATPLYTARTPTGTQPVASVHSPRIATLIRLTNTPSDNYLAEMLVKGLGARFGRGGTTAAGAAVVRSQLAGKFGIHPRLVDGSGLSRADWTSPREVVTLLDHLATNSAFVGSLASAGETGTLAPPRMQGTAAQGRCRGKTGSLRDVSNLVGYCRARDGHMLAFAFLMNAISPSYARPIQDRMAVAMAKYNG
jgi:D-alanyl-D-alanine carboxypeptidase/D-alanyl-D-alanine-endopeptidase (penicillin-binding protein 4)